MKPYIRKFQENEATPQFQIIDHGVDHAQYFPGHGSGRFSDTVTGAGSTPEEAINNALEQMTSSYTIEDKMIEAIEKEAKEMYGDQYDVTPDQLKNEEVNEDGEPNEEYNENSELYYYISIDFNLSYI